MVDRMIKIDSLLLRALREIIIRTHQHTSFGIMNVTRVHTSKDLKNCTVYVSAERNCDDVCIFLKRRVGVIQKELSEKIELRHTPKLCFKYDDSTDYISNIQSLITKIEQK